MTDFRKIILSQFHGKHLYSNFGAALKSVTINGFRGIDNLRIEFDYPITAISGANGSGKSTIGQLIACAYKQPQTDKKYKRRYIKDFFPVSVLDPNPFSDSAAVKFQYATNTDILQDLTVSRANSEWSGYKRQPERHSFYVGFSLYIPKVERKDISVYSAQFIKLGEKRTVTDEAKRHVSSILNSNYSEVSFQSISHLSRTIELGFVNKFGKSYSENNMGFGEGRLLYMIDLLESEPNNSLFVLEEPETSLHEDAQYKFVKYLIEVCARKKHQIILSTHSSIILDALPAEGRKFVVRDNTGVKIIDRVSGSRARSMLADGNVKSLRICVEDEFAKHFLIEMIRKINSSLFSSIMIMSIGDKSAVQQVVKQMIDFNIKAIGVRDGDVGENKKEKLYSFPGSLPPEKEVYCNENVKDVLNKYYSIDIDSILAGNDIDHHDYGEVFSKKAFCSEEDMNLCAIRAYLNDVQIDEFEQLVSAIENEI